MELPDLKVVSWNVSCGIFQAGPRNDPIEGGQYIADTLLRLQADIVGLQEVLLPGPSNNTSLPDVIASHTGYPFYKAIPLSPSHLVDGGSLGLAVFSRYAITDSVLVVLPNPNITTRGPAGTEWKTHDKGLLICRIQVGNQNIRCICGHLPPFDTFSRDPGEAAFKPLWNKIELTLREYENLPLIAFVDFNTDRVRDFLPVLRDRSIKLMVSQPTRTDGRLHDQILYSSAFMSRSITVTASRFDHHICNGNVALKPVKSAVARQPKTPEQGLCILHLSDLHFGPGTREDVDWKTYIEFADREKRKDRLIQYLRNLPVVPAYVIVSGDLTIAAHEEGFKEFFDMVDDLIKEGVLPEVNRILIVPGNHDVTRRVSGKTASAAQRWKFFREKVSQRFASPWFPDHDPPQPQVLKELRSRLKGNFERLGGPARKIDARSGKADRPSLPFLIDIKEKLLIYAFNSASVSGTNIKLPPDIEAAMTRLRQKSGTLKSDLDTVLNSFERELSIDPARIDPREFNLFNETINILRDKISEFDSFLKIAVLHHHVDPVIPEEVTKFENLINAGRFKHELSDAGFQLVLHGHKHWPNVHIDISADDETRKLIVSGGTIGGDTAPGSNPGFYWIEAPKNTSALHIDFLSVSSVGNPRVSIANALKRRRSYQLAKSPNSPADPLPIRISLDTVFSKTHNSLFGFIRTRKDGAAGWSHMLDDDRISIVGSAYALSILRLIKVTSQKTETLVPRVIDTLLKSQNPDGGWSASSQSTTSQPEPTAFVLASLSKWLSYHEISSTIDLLENMIDENDSVFWTNPYCLSTLARILSELKPSSKKLPLFASALLKGACRTPEGGISHWENRFVNSRTASSSPTKGSVLHTAHAMIALKQLFDVSEGKFGSSSEDLSGAHHWIVGALPWRDTAEDINRPRADGRYDNLVVKHFTVPWATIALLRTGSVSDISTVRTGINSLLDGGKEGLWNWGELQRPIWATHDALFALIEYSLRCMAA